MRTPVMAILSRVTAFLLIWAVLLAPSIPVIRKYELAAVLDRPTSRLALESLALASTILAVAVAIWLFDRRTLGTLGFVTGKSFQHMLLGLGLGAGMVGLTLGLLGFTGQLELSSGTRLIPQPLPVMTPFSAMQFCSR